jgi:hypothetical protein
MEWSFSEGVDTKKGHRLPAHPEQGLGFMQCHRQGDPDGPGCQRSRPPREISPVNEVDLFTTASSRHSLYPLGDHNASGRLLRPDFNGNNVGAVGASHSIFDLAAFLDTGHNSSCAGSREKPRGSATLVLNIIPNRTRVNPLGE